MLRNGYSRQVVQDNITQGLKSGADRNSAIRAAFNHARMSYFKRYPSGALPGWLCFPKGYRLAQFYSEYGVPLRTTAMLPRDTNPVRELDMTDAEREKVRREVSKMFSGQGRAIRQAAKLYADFSGHEDVKIGKVQIPDTPQVMLAIGTVDGILYTTVRDGETEKYIHRFRSSARPLLMSSPDGQQLFLIGGSYNFTERGIVDHGDKSG